MADSDSRNKIAMLVALLAGAFLLAAAIESTVLLSYIAVLFILSVYSVGAIENNGSELNVQPYGGIILSLGFLLLAGMTGIWLTWTPGTSADAYTYTFGLPTPTAIFLTFIWFLPFFISIYYAIGPFGRTINDEIIDSIIDDARDKQAESEFAMAPSDESVGGDD
ncbi:hypothetical protein [Natrinema salinisoli]|uniref:hypothetical protein n=1 Tax=Natrinema salinisoli TaxID=2878535 RepID=UPI001CF0645E|nr:hypothetical protein [Natrinema salinisoli]